MEIPYLGEDGEIITDPQNTADRLKVVRNKKLKILIPDNIFFLYLIIIKLCTLKRLENIHQKLKIKFS